MSHNLWLGLLLVHKLCEAGTIYVHKLCEVGMIYGNYEPVKNHASVTQFPINDNRGYFGN